MTDNDRPHHYRPTREGRCDTCGRAPRSHRAMDARADAYYAPGAAAARAAAPRPYGPFTAELVGVIRSDAAQRAADRFMRKLASDASDPSRSRCGLCGSLVGNFHATGCPGELVGGRVDGPTR